VTSDCVFIFENHYLSFLLAQCFIAGIDIMCVLLVVIEYHW